MKPHLISSVEDSNDDTVTHTKQNASKLADEVLDQKSPELLQREAHVKTLAAIEASKREKDPVDTVSYQTEWNAATGRIKKVPLSQLDVNDEVLDRLQQKAESERLKAQADLDSARFDEQADFDDLFPSEKRLALERYWTPIIKKLATAHEDACDAQAGFEDDETRFKADLQARFAFELKHPDIKTMFCSSDTHFNEMLKTGHLHIDGYKMVERRSAGGHPMMIGDTPVSTPRSSTLVYIPVHVESLMSYAHSDEAKQHSQQLYDLELQRLIARRKKAAVMLTEAKQSARDALAAIPTFEQLVSDTVKRSKK
ncbi:hypothetical protein [Pantoea eucrina]|uniref:hypothetical protein n=1 Tax=Pantoea eucrina TaxID=472693 RepID=UPI00301D9567